MIPLRVVTLHDAHPDLSRRELHRVARAAHRSVGVKWAVDILPEHFGQGAGSRYGYTPRTHAWNRRKQQAKRFGKSEGGYGDDLVFTGELRRQVLQSARFNIDDYPSRVTIRMTGPKYFTLRARSKHTIRIAQEILRYSLRDLRVLGDTFESAFNRELRSVRADRRARKTTRTG